MRMELLGSSGKLIYTHMPPFSPDLQQLHLQGLNGTPKMLLRASDMLGSSATDTRLPALKRLLQNFVQTTKQVEVSDLPSFEDGLVVQSALHAIRQSAASDGKTINFFPF